MVALYTTEYYRYLFFALHPCLEICTLNFVSNTPGYFVRLLRRKGERVPGNPQTLLHTRTVIIGPIQEYSPEAKRFLFYFFFLPRNKEPGCILL